MSTSTTRPRTTKINCSKFYSEWKGHPISDLAKFRSITLSECPDKPIVYLAGDSSLDNKFWVKLSNHDPSTPIPKIYNKTLNTSQPKPDVAFWMNHLLGSRATCINTAVEESMLRDRDTGLLPHDEFIRDNIRAQDALIVSVGANDVALRPTAATIWNMLRLAWLTSHAALESGTAAPLKYFAHMFGPKINSYIDQMTAKAKPRVVIVCMIYFPLETGLGQRSWADHQLRALGYNSYPKQLQAGIRAMYRLATEKIRVQGSEVLPCALYEVLDGKTAEDYTDRVEPSGSGGKKMAERFVKLLDGRLELA